MAHTCAIAAEHNYRVSVAAGLAEVHVRAELVGDVQALAASDGEVARLDDLATCTGQSLPTRRNRIVVAGRASCLHYRYPLRAARTDRAPRVAEGVAVSSPGEWLWVPPLTGGDRVRIEFELPPQMRASVPWQPLPDGGFRLSASPASSRAVVVFGAFEEHVIEIPGAILRLALIDGPDQQLDASKIIGWLRAAALDVAAVSGRFPNPELQVIVQASDRRGWGEGWDGPRSAVPFGYVIRDGGEAVRFFVDAERPLADFLGDWTATHEFSHLLLPYVRSRDKWISEGFASYYQNVLLARSGVYTEQDAWRRLHRSFENARAIKNPPALNRISERPFWEVRMLIYWSGAAIALMADAELRRLSDSNESLDTVLGRLQACCLPSDRTWSGEELFAKLDELSRYPVFEELYRRYAYNPGMPPLGELYARLGVVATGRSSVALTDAAPNACVRDAIMASDS